MEKQKYVVLSDIEDSWSNYDKMVAKSHLHNFGKIYCDKEFLTPIDDEYELEDIHENERETNLLKDITKTISLKEISHLYPNYIDCLNSVSDGHLLNKYEINVEMYKTDNFEEKITIDMVNSDFECTDGIYKIVDELDPNRYIYAKINDKKVTSLFFDDEQIKNVEQLKEIEENKHDLIKHYFMELNLYSYKEDLEEINEEINTNLIEEFSSCGKYWIPTDTSLIDEQERIYKEMETKRKELEKKSINEMFDYYDSKSKGFPKNMCSWEFRYHLLSKGKISMGKSVEDYVMIMDSLLECDKPKFLKFYELHLLKLEMQYQFNISHFGKFDEFKKLDYSIQKLYQNLSFAIHEQYGSIHEQNGSILDYDKLDVTIAFNQVFEKYIETKNIDFLTIDDLFEDFDVEDIRDFLALTILYYKDDNIFTDEVVQWAESVPTDYFKYYGAEQLLLSDEPILNDFVNNIIFDKEECFREIEVADDYYL